jgi:membrane-associated phospholipid phosphatase
MNRNSSNYQPVMKSNRLAIPPKRLIAAYIFDWLIIIILAAIGAGLSKVSPQHRAFSLVDLNISFPYVLETISTVTLALVALVAPAVIIAVVTLIFVPGPRFSRSINRSQLIRLKLWELEKGLAGLCLSVAIAFFITQGTKNLFGKPRPDLLARCMPDYDNLARYRVSDYAARFNQEWVLVTSAICQQPDKALLDDGFRSFPSGHSSFSWSGLLYLSLFMCSKFQITIPYLPGSASRPADYAAPNSHVSAPTPSKAHQDQHHTAYDGAGADATTGLTATHTDDHSPATTAANEHASPTTRTFQIQNAAATPPNYLLILVIIPLAVAVYIVSTRFVEYYHFGFDVISGSLIGIFSSWGAFRWYHLPISRGHGWAWGPRSANRAFAIGVGTDGYVGREGWRDTERSSSGSSSSSEEEEEERLRRRDLEAGRV